MLRSYMQDDITVIFFEGTGDWQEPLPALEVEMKSYIEWKTHWVRNQAGEMVVARATVYIIYSRLLNHSDKIKVEDVEYVILNLGAGKDFSPNHQEVHIQ